MSSNPFCGYAALRGDWEGFLSILYWVCDSFNWLLHPAPPHTFHGAFLHICCLIPRPQMLNMVDHEWSVLNLICHDVSGLTEWEKAQKVVHCKGEKKKAPKKPQTSNHKARLEDQNSLLLHLLLPEVWAVDFHSETNVWNLRSQCHSPQADTKTSGSQQCCVFAQGVCGGVATSLIRTGKFLTQIPSKGS